MPKALDEAIVGNLNSIIHSNNAIVRSISSWFNASYLVCSSKLILVHLLQVVSLLKDDSTFIKELFARLKSPTISMESKKTLVHIGPHLSFSH